MYILGTRQYQYLLRDICRQGNFQEAVVEMRPCPDGERILRIRTNFSVEDVAVVGGTISESDTLELYDLACGAIQNGARRLTLVVPYFGYSTMERAVEPGEVVTAKTRARLLSAIPIAPAGNRVVLLDLHCESLPYYFEGAIRPIHLSAKSLAMAAARRLGGDDFILASADVGGVKWVQSLARELGVGVAFVLKRRLTEEHTEITAVSAQVEGKRVIIYDDMIRSGSTLLAAAKAYHEAGAQAIAAVAIHGVLPNDSLEKLRASGLFTAIVCTDSHPRARELNSEYLSIQSIAGLLAGFLQGD